MSFAEDTAAQPAAAYAQVIAALGAETTEPSRDLLAFESLLRLTDVFRHHWLEQPQHAAGSC